MNYSQKELEIIGNYGCAFISLLHALNITSIDKCLELFRKGKKEGVLDEDCTVLNWDKLAKMISGHTYQTTKVDGKERPKTYSKDILIARYHNKRTNFYHFCDVTHELYDPLENSVTVKEGYIESYRLLTFVN